MKHLTDSTLSAIDRASSKLGLLGSLLDKIMGRVVPSIAASACTGALCKEVCTGIPCHHGNVGYRYYSPNAAGCLNHFYTCRASFCAC